MLDTLVAIANTGTGSPYLEWQTQTAVEKSQVRMAKVGPIEFEYLTLFASGSSIVDLSHRNVRYPDKLEQQIFVSSLFKSAKMIRREDR